MTHVSIYSLSLGTDLLVTCSEILAILRSLACLAHILRSCFFPSFGIEFQIQSSDALLAINITGSMNIHPIGADSTYVKKTTNKHLQKVALRIAPHFLPINIICP